MLDIAFSGEQGPVSLKKMAARQDISADYLEQLLRRLRKAGLVVSIRGPRGGFRLARPADRIFVWDIVSALEDPLAPVFCVDEVMGQKSREGRCRRMSGCATHILWEGLARHIRAFLESRTLADLVEDARRICNESTVGTPITFEI